MMLAPDGHKDYMRDDFRAEDRRRPQKLLGLVLKEGHSTGFDVVDRTYQ